MPEFSAAGPRRRRALGPVAVTAALAAVAAVAIAGTAPPVVGPGWVLAWLLLGLTAGYALSGSA
ncbi:MAG TPA: hypothetical protein VHH34_06775 [Pseudonocardiaceae bacterium]|nr:hypothetical protein [Pseudonocardiaceae bacterium]